MRNGRGGEPGQGAAQEAQGARGGEPGQSSHAPAGSRGAGAGGTPDFDAGSGEGSTAVADRTPQGVHAEGPLGDEQRLAYEQWLRRIPDDPGGLLRRKFALEYRERGARLPSRSDAW